MPVTLHARASRALAPIDIGMFRARCDTMWMDGTGCVRLERWQMAVSRHETRCVPVQPYNALTRAYDSSVAVYVASWQSVYACCCEAIRRSTIHSTRRVKHAELNALILMPMPSVQ